MSPVLQTLVTLTVRILLGLLFLCEVALAVRNDLSHMIDVILLVLAWVLLGVLLQDCNDFATRIVTDSLPGTIIFGPLRRLEMLSRIQGCIVH